MKKNKAMIYVLGAAVILVWGMIIYQVLAALGGDDEPEQTVSRISRQTHIEEPAEDSDTGKLNLNYPDPFRQSAVVKDTIKQPPITNTIARPITVSQGLSVRPAFTWPVIRYSGFIKNPKSRSLLALVTIGNESRMMSEGESAAGVRLLKNMKDSIKIASGKHTKVLVLNQGTP